MTVTHPLAVAWLERVERLAADLPPDQRSELLADLHEHLDAALSTDGGDVSAVLDRLGDPVDVVAAARTDAPPPPPTVARTDGLLMVEVLAIAALVVAGLVGILSWPLALVLWAIGIVLAAVRGRWRGGEVIGIVLLPVGWVLPAVSLIVPVGMTATSCTAGTDGIEVCETIEQGLGGPWVLVAAVAGLVALVLVTRWLARAPGGRPER